MFRKIIAALMVLLGAAFVAIMGAGVKDNLRNMERADDSFERPFTARVGRAIDLCGNAQKARVAVADAVCESEKFEATAAVEMAGTSVLLYRMYIEKAWWATVAGCAVVAGGLLLWPRKKAQAV